MSARLTVPKTYKMLIGGAFVRGDSGKTRRVRSGEVEGSGDGAHVHVPLASRKDVRDAVAAARSAAGAWGRRGAYERGLVLYRLAEMLESRGPELVVALRRGGAKEADARREVNAAVDRCVYYAGFCDKVTALLGSVNPVAGPYLGYSTVEPAGVVGVVVSAASPLVGLVSWVLPALAAGNVVVALADAGDPRPAALFAEASATSDLPAGVVNVLFGEATVARELARHGDINALVGDIDAADARADLEREAAATVKRVTLRPVPDPREAIDPQAGQGLGYLEPLVETKSVWHPVGI